MIRFVGTSFTSLQEVLNAALDTAAGVRIAIDDDASLTLSGFSRSALTSQDFPFARRTRPGGYIA